jgi:hypothetical protein
MSLKPVHETTRSSAALVPIAASPPIEWAAVIDDIVLEIWLRCKCSDVVGFSKACRRFYKLLFNRPIGDSFWVDLAIRSFPDLTNQQAQFSGPAFFKKYFTICISLRRANLEAEQDEGLSRTWVQQCHELPCLKIPESALLENEGKGLLLCSKDMKLCRYGFDSAPSNPVPQKTGDGDSAFRALEGPVCRDGNGRVFAVGTDKDGLACVNLLNIETGAVKKTFLVGAENSRIKPPYSSDYRFINTVITMGQKLFSTPDMFIQSLCATDRYVIALAKVDCVGCMLIWDRSAPHGNRAPRMQFTIDSVADMQLKGNTLYWVETGASAGCNLCFLNLDDIDNCNPKYVDSFIKKHVTRRWMFYRKKDGSDLQVEIKSFITEGRFIFFHCIANGIPDLRIMKQDQDTGAWLYHKSLETVSRISHIRKESGFIAAFLEENNSVQFFDFSPDYKQLQSEINKELSSVTNNLASLGTFGLSQKECFQYFGRHWLWSLHQIGITSLNDFEMILKLLPKSSAPKFIPHFTDDLQDASLFIGGLVRGQEVGKRHNRWMRDKKCSLIASPWEPISDKAWSLSEALKAHWKSNGSFSDGEVYLDLLKQVNAFVDEWNLATKIEIFQMYICNPERIDWWQEWSKKAGIQSLSGAPKTGSIDFDLAFWRIFTKLN